MKAVILAGGLGTRLKPFTEIIPKPLLPIGESSVLEIQILSLKNAGVTDIFIATNYMSEYVKAYIGNGEKYGVNIKFSHESIPLGTCGPVALLKEELTEPFLLMNGDILTTLNFQQVYDFALKQDSDFVVITKEIVTPFNFGQVITDGDYITEIHEKPDFKLEILSGIYVLKPNLFKIIPENTYYGIDHLIKDMLKNKMNVSRFLMKDYWLDIGRIEDYQVAQNAYQQHFKQLKE